MGEIWRKANREEPMVLACKVDDPPPSARYGPVIRDIYLLECCESGYGSVIINGQEFPIGPGDCYALFPGDAVIHTTAAENPRRGIWCAVDGLALGRYLKAAGISSEKPFAARDAFPVAYHWMQQMLSQADISGGGISLLQTACVYGVLGAMLQSKSSGSKETLIEKAIGLMETDYPEPLNIGSLARQVGLARAYFSTLFKEQTGLAPYQYLTALRIRKSCSLLIDEPNRAVSEIAELVGLDPRNFARFFKKEIGQTPLEYRRDHISY